jgi:hypothetical protein
LLSADVVTERSFNGNRSEPSQSECAFLQEVSAIARTKVASCHDALTILNGTIQENIQKTAKLDELEL